jgi:Domain of unknown function (DUF4291)
MMYRSAWGTSEGQEVVLAMRIRREAFDQILRAAVPPCHCANTLALVEGPPIVLTPANTVCAGRR